jgi:hypothetical protein
MIYLIDIFDTNQSVFMLCFFFLHNVRNKTTDRDEHFWPSLWTAAFSFIE